MSAFPAELDVLLNSKPLQWNIRQFLIVFREPYFDWCFWLLGQRSTENLPRSFLKGKVEEGSGANNGFVGYLFRVLNCSKGRPSLFNLTAFFKQLREKIIF